MIYYIFIDGIGFGKNEPDSNPFARFARNILIPLAGKDLNQERFARIRYLETDATLGIDGLPQSATGQTALWTGINAAAVTGRHISGFPTFTLKKIIRQFSILKILNENGLNGSFVNCYTTPFFELMKQYPDHLPASTLVQLAAGKPLHTIENLRDNTGIYMDITNELLLKRTVDNQTFVKKRDPYHAGKDITQIKNLDLLMFEYFLTDKAGHDKNWEAAGNSIRILEAFLTGIMENMSADDQLIVSSDHGNMEDLSTSWHTRNPVPTILYGKYTDLLAKKINSLYDIPRSVYDLLGIKPKLDFNQ